VLRGRSPGDWRPGSLYSMKRNGRESRNGPGLGNLQIHGTISLIATCTALRVEEGSRVPPLRFSSPDTTPPRDTLTKCFVPSASYST
jgi:hypothetical protein